MNEAHKVFHELDDVGDCLGKAGKSSPEAEVFEDGGPFELKLAVPGLHKYIVRVLVAQQVYQHCYLAHAFRHFEGSDAVESIPQHNLRQDRAALGDCFDPALDEGLVLRPDGGWEEEGGLFPGERMLGRDRTRGLPLEETVDEAQKVAYSDRRTFLRRALEGCWGWSKYIIQLEDAGHNNYNLATDSRSPLGYNDLPSGAPGPASIPARHPLSLTFFHPALPLKTTL